jgi:hypothetical protein
MRSGILNLSPSLSLSLSPPLSLTFFSYFILPIGFGAEVLFFGQIGIQKNLRKETHSQEIREKHRNPKSEREKEVPRRFPSHFLSYSLSLISLIPINPLIRSLNTSICSRSEVEGEEVDDLDGEEEEGVLMRSTVQINSHMFVTLTHHLSEKTFTFIGAAQAVPLLDMDEREGEREGAVRAEGAGDGDVVEVTFKIQPANFILREKGNYFRRLLVEVQQILSFFLFSDLKI